MLITSQLFSPKLYSKRNTVYHKTLVGENFGRVGTARKMTEKTLVVDTENMFTIQFRPHNFLADKTLADWQ